MSLFSVCCTCGCCCCCNDEIEMSLVWCIFLLQDFVAVVVLGIVIIGGAMVLQQCTLSLLFSGSCVGECQSFCTWHRSLIPRLRMRRGVEYVRFKAVVVVYYEMWWPTPTFWGSTIMWWGVSWCECEGSLKKPTRLEKITVELHPWRIYWRSSLQEVQSSRSCYTSSHTPPSHAQLSWR